MAFLCKRGGHSILRQQDFGKREHSSLLIDINTIQVRYTIFPLIGAPPLFSVPSLFFIENYQRCSFSLCFSIFLRLCLYFPIKLLAIVPLRRKKRETCKWVILNKLIYRGILNKWEKHDFFSDLTRKACAWFWRLTLTMTDYDENDDEGDDENDD